MLACPRTKHEASMTRAEQPSIGPSAPTPKKETVPVSGKSRKTGDKQEPQERRLNGSAPLGLDLGSRISPHWTKPQERWLGGSGPLGFVNACGISLLASRSTW